MVDIIPAILSTTRADFHLRFKAVEPFTEWIQIDFVDGRFAPNKTVGPEIIKQFRTSRKLEIQLMVNFIEDWIDPFVELKPTRIIFPVETAHDPIGLINHLNRHRIQVGFSLNPHTPVERLRHLVDKIHCAVLLAVNPGFQGQPFYEGVYQKIKDLKSMNPDVYVEVDGAQKPGIARKCAQAGANGLAVGSFVLKNDRIEGSTYQERIKNAIEALKKDVEGVN